MDSQYRAIQHFWRLAMALFDERYPHYLLLALLMNHLVRNGCTLRTHISVACSRTQTCTQAASREQHRAIQVRALDISELLGIFNVFSAFRSRGGTATQIIDYWKKRARFRRHRLTFRVSSGLGTGWHGNVIVCWLPEQHQIVHMGCYWIICIEISAQIASLRSSARPRNHRNWPTTMTFHFAIGIHTLSTVYRK